MAEQTEVIRDLVIPSSADQIQVVEEQAEQMIRMGGFNDDERDSIAIALTEMVANAIFHGNKADAGKKVHVRLHLTETAFTVTIRDEGRGFDPHRVADPLRPENLLKDSGRGIFIVRTLMDDVDFKVTEEGTSVILSKKRKHREL